MPSFIPPCLPSFATEVPIGPAWVYEIKHDGYRFMLRNDGAEPPWPAPAAKGTKIASEIRDPSY